MSGPIDGPIDAEDSPEEEMHPSPEQFEARARRANRATRGALAGVLTLEGLIVLLIPRAIAFSSGLGTGRTVVLVILAVLLVLTAGVLRRPFGIGVGSAMQVLFTLTGIFVPTMFLVGAIFLAIWLRLLLLRHEIVGSPGGLRMLAG